MLIFGERHRRSVLARCAWRYNNGQRPPHPDRVEPSPLDDEFECTQIGGAALRGASADNAPGSRSGADYACNGSDTPAARSPRRAAAR